MQQTECARNCWIIGAISGLVVLILVSAIGDTGWLGGLFLGAVTCVLLGGVLVWLLGDGPQPPYDPALPSKPVTVVSAARPAPSSGISVTASVDATGVVPGAQAKPKAASKPAVKVGKKPTRDDLKKINGIGPKIEEALNANGISTFAQIAAWTEADERDIATRLGRLGGRIGPDDWVGQAGKLAGQGDG